MSFSCLKLLTGLQILAILEPFYGIFNMILTIDEMADHELWSMDLFLVAWFAISLLCFLQAFYNMKWLTMDSKSTRKLLVLSFLIQVVTCVCLTILLLVMAIFYSAEFELIGLFINFIEFCLFVYGY